MARNPQRRTAKRSLRLRVNASSLERGKEFYQAYGRDFTSFSQFFESVVFLMELIYLSDDSEEFIRSLRQRKADLFLSATDFENKPSTVTLSVCLDESCGAFLELLKGKYHGSFSGVNEVATLFLEEVAQYARTEQEARYFSRRLFEAQQSHPVYGQPH